MKTRVTYESRVLRQTSKKKNIFGSSDEVLQRRKKNKGEH